MKKLLLMFTLGASVWACTPKNQYTIEGTVEGETSGNALLIAIGEEKMDTLATAPVVDGKFTLAGTVAVPQVALLTVEGTRSRVLMVVENVKLTAALNTTDPAQSSVAGSAEQEVFKAYNDLTAASRSKLLELNKTYAAAVEAKDEEKIQQIRQEFADAQKANEEQETALIAAHPDRIATAFIVSNKMGSMPVEKLTERYNLLGETAKNSAFGVKIGERLVKLDVVAIGKVAPDFTQNNPAGEPVSLHGIKAKVKIIDFWASWCGPCRQTNPSVVELYKKFHDKGLEIIGVSLDTSKENWEKAIQDDNLTWIHVSDLKRFQNEVAELYCVGAIPHLVILDENNVIVDKNLHGDELTNKIAEMLK